MIAEIHLNQTAKPMLQKPSLKEKKNEKAQLSPICFLGGGRLQLRLSIFSSELQIYLTIYLNQNIERYSHSLRLNSNEDIT